MEDMILEIKETEKIRTTSENKAFYKKVVEDSKIFDRQHQLFTYAFLIAIHKDLEPCKDTKSEDICQVQNINKDNFAIVKGIAAKKFEVVNGNELLKQILEYADAGINYLKIEYENNDGILRLDKYIE